MDRERWNEVERLFIDALRRPEGEREEFLEQQCGDDEDLHREITSLIGHDAAEDDSLAAAVRDGALDAAEERGPTVRGRRIGPYRIERELGEGGMGAVFLAVRDDQAYSKEVAIKLLRSGFVRESVIRRFVNERQILASLEHPNIAHLLDGGTTDTGEPYVVMEYVEGRSIDSYCDEEGLDVRARLALFANVCAAVQVAHEKRIVHRDIKPSNILVTSEGVPKLLDFGIAKLLDPQSLPQFVDHTGTSTRWMTPEYASPEQVRGEPVTAATDVYALGVLLYRLVTGRSPYEFGKGRPALEQSICEIDPPRPSAVTKKRELRRQLTGDLDNLVLMALRKEPERRYASAGELHDDIRRFLDDLPIAARRATLGYRLGRYIHRKPAHAALIATLIVATPTVAVLTARSMHQQSVLRQARIDELVEDAGWALERGRLVQAVGLADAALDLDGDHPVALRHRALARARIASHSDPDVAQELIRGALADAERLIRGQPAAAWPYALKAHILRGRGRDDEARVSQEMADARQGGTDEDLEFAALLALERRDYRAAIDLYSELIRRRPERASAISTRAFAYEQLGDADTAFAEYRIAAGVNPEADLTLIDLARLSTDRGELDEARDYLDRAFELDRESADAHQIHGYLLIERGMRALDAGEPERAAELLRQSEEASRRALELDPEMHQAEANIAAVLIERHRMLDRVEPALLEEVVEVYRPIIDGWQTVPDSRDDRRLLYQALANTCDTLIQLERLDEALEICTKTTTTFPGDAVGFYNLAGVLALLGREEDALDALEQDLRLGDTDWKYLVRDEWFAGLRNHPRFVALVARMKELAGA